MLLGQHGVTAAGSLFDTMIAAYLLNPNKSNHSLDEISFEYLSRKKKSFMEVIRKRASFAEVPLDEATSYAAEDAALAYELKDLLFRKLGAAGALEDLFRYRDASHRSAHRHGEIRHQDRSLRYWKAFPGKCPSK